MFAGELVEKARDFIAVMRRRGLMLACAESCTGGLLGGLITQVPGASDVFERGFVTYSNAAKATMLGIEPGLIETHGAVSREVALAMASGALAHAEAQLALAITGIAGPDGGSTEKPVGLVHIAAAYAPDGDRIEPQLSHQEHRFGDLGRYGVRARALHGALDLAFEMLGEEPQSGL